MISKLDIEVIHMTISDNIRRYAVKKIGKLDKYLPKAAKQSAHAQVMLKTSQGKNRYTCEVVLNLPKETINVKESTVSIFAAIDIVEAKLKNRIQKYKELHNSGRARRRILDRLRKKDVQGYH